MLIGIICMDCLGWRIMVSLWVLEGLCIDFFASPFHLFRFYF